MRIQKLTQEQKEYLPIFREEYLSAAIGGKRIDRKNLEAAIGDAYAEIGKEKPILIILQSPLQAMMAIQFMKSFCETIDLSSPLSDQLKSPLSDQLRAQLGAQLGGQLSAQLMDQLWTQLLAQLWDQLQDQLRAQLSGQLWDQLKSPLSDQLGGQLSGQLQDQLGAQLRAQLGTQLGTQLRGQLRAQLGAQLGIQLGTQLRGQLRAQLGAQLGGLRDQLGTQLWTQLRGQLSGQLQGQLWDQLWGALSAQLRDQLSGQLGGQLRERDIYDPHYLLGSQDLYWIAWAKFAEHIGVKFTGQQSKRLDIMKRIGFECEWWWPYDGICFVSEKPIEVHWNSDNVLHNENGKSVAYADGYGIYSFNGVSVPREWIEDKENLRADTVLKWENIEQRTVGCEILGWNNILKELGAVTIQKDDDPMIGELLEVEIPEVGKRKFLRVLCGTGREFALSVPSHMQTALEANAWSYNIPPELFNIEVRT